MRAGGRSSSKSPDASRSQTAVDDARPGRVEVPARRGRGARRAAPAARRRTGPTSRWGRCSAAAGRSRRHRVQPAGGDAEGRRAQAVRHGEAPPQAPPPPRPWASAGSQPGEVDVVGADVADLDDAGAARGLAPPASQRRPAASTSKKPEGAADPRLAVVGGGGARHGAHGSRRVVACDLGGRAPMPPAGRGSGACDRPDEALACRASASPIPPADGHGHDEQEVRCPAQRRRPTGRSRLLDSRRGPPLGRADPLALRGPTRRDRRAQRLPRARRRHRHQPLPHLRRRGRAHARAPTDARRADALLAVFAKHLLWTARGNSGVILSQLARGLAEGCAGVRRIDGRVLADGLRHAEQRGPAGRDRPQGGHHPHRRRARWRHAAATRGMPRRSDRVPRQARPVHAVALAAVEAARVALEHTPEQLEVLARAGVVDAGGAGLVVLLECLERVCAGQRASLGRRRPSRPPARLRPDTCGRRPAAARPASAPERPRAAPSSR